MSLDSCIIFTNTTLDSLRKKRYLNLGFLFGIGGVANMSELLEGVIPLLNTHQLQDIVSVNNIKLQGFRTNSKNSQAKNVRMRQELIKKRYLNDYLEKTIEYYRDTQKRDFSWALVDGLTDDEIHNQISKSNIGEVIFALFAANKLERIGAFLEKNLNDKDLSNVESNDIQNNDDITNNLRGIIRDLEDKNNNYKKKFIEYSNLVKDYEIQTESYKNEISNLKDLDFKNKEKIKELYINIDSLECEKKKLVDDYIPSNQLRLLVICGNSIRNFWDWKTSDIKSVKTKIVAPKCISDDINKIYDHMIIINFSITKLEYKKAIESVYFDIYSSLGKVIFLENVDEMEKYIEGVSEYYA